MKRILFYSHDTYGLGNIRRTLSICRSLTTHYPDLSILIVSGSPMIQSFRIPPGVDYVKLPCLTRSEQDGYTAKFLEEHPEDLLKLRSDMILGATANFQPDLIMVDKKPLGVQQELASTLRYVKDHLSKTHVTLLLRDILDSPEVTRRIWHKAGYVRAIEQFYDHVFILGCPTVFDLPSEYRFPPAVQERIQFCGYIQREPGLKSPQEIRSELGINPLDQFVLVTAGGGEDGAAIFKTYLSGLRSAPLPASIKALLVFGPEMSAPERQQLTEMAGEHAPQVQSFDFTEDLMSYIQAADLVVSMGGYGTVCEILSANKRAILIPRIHPVQEQAIRAQRLACMGIVQMIHPNFLSATRLMASVLREVTDPRPALNGRKGLRLEALSCISAYVTTVFEGTSWPAQEARGPQDTPLSEKPDGLAAGLLHTHQSS